MIRTGEAYRASLCDNREVWIGGAQVHDIGGHSQLAPIVGLRSRLYDMQHAPDSANVLRYCQGGETFAISAKLPKSQADWWAKRQATEAILSAAGSVVYRIGDDTLGEMWSLQDAAEELNDIDPQFSDNITRQVQSAARDDLFLVTGNTDLTGDRAAALSVVRETDGGLIVRGAKFQTAAAYANQTYTKPTIAEWADAETSDQVIGFVADLATPGIRIICREGHISPSDGAPPFMAEIDSLVIYDDVLIPWERVLFYRHTRAARVVRASLHRYSAFAFMQRSLKLADLLIGVALLCLRRAGLDGQQAVQEKLAELACYRETINAHMTASITMAERSPSGLMMPNQSLLYAGRHLAMSQTHHMMQIARELCGGQLMLTPDAASFASAETGALLAGWYAQGDAWPVEDLRKLTDFAHDLLNSERAHHRLGFQMFAQAPAYTHLAALYRNFDWDGPLSMVQHAAGLGDGVLTETTLTCADSPVSKWFSLEPRRSRPVSTLST